MRIAILYAPGDEGLAEVKRAAIGADDALIAPLTATLAFGPNLALLVLWTSATDAYVDVVERLAAGHGVVVWRIDGTPVPSTLERVAVAAETSQGGIGSALKLAAMENERAPREETATRRRGKPLVAVAAGIAAVLALGAAGAAAFMLDGEAPISLIATGGALAPERN